MTINFNDFMEKAKTMEGFDQFEEQFKQASHELSDSDLSQLSDSLDADFIEALQVAEEMGFDEEHFAHMLRMLFGSE